MNLLSQLTNKSFLTKCWKCVIRGKNKNQRESSRGADEVTLQEFGDNLSENIAEIEKHLREKKYDFQPLKQVLIPKPNSNNFRQISVPAVRDRVVQRGLFHLLNNLVFEHLDNGVSYCVGRRNSFRRSKYETKNGPQKAIKMIFKHLKGGHLWVFETDIESFFDSVPKSRMLTKIERIIGDDRSLHELIKKSIHFELKRAKMAGEEDDIITKQVGIAQGSALSPLFANIYLDELDYAMKNQYGDRYVRYVDDFLVLCSTRTEAIQAERFSQEQIQPLALSLKESKTITFNIKRRELKFLGLGLSSNGISSKLNKAKLNKKFNEEVISIKKEKRQKLDRDLTRFRELSIINSQIKGFEAFFCHYHSWDMFKELNTLIEKKRKDEKYKNLRKLYINSIKPVVSLSEWRAVFE